METAIMLTLMFLVAPAGDEAYHAKSCDDKCKVQILQKQVSLLKAENARLTNIRWAKAYKRLLERNLRLNDRNEKLWRMLKGVASEKEDAEQEASRLRKQNKLLRRNAARVEANAIKAWSEVAKAQNELISARQYIVLYKVLWKNCKAK